MSSPDRCINLRLKAEMQAKRKDYWKLFAPEVIAQVNSVVETRRDGRVGILLAHVADKPVHHPILHIPDLVTIKEAEFTNAFTTIGMLSKFPPIHVDIWCSQAVMLEMKVQELGYLNSIRPVVVVCDPDLTVAYHPFQADSKISLSAFLTYDEGIEERGVGLIYKPRSPEAILNIFVVGNFPSSLQPASTKLS